MDSGAAVSLVKRQAVKGENVRKNLQLLICDVQRETIPLEGIIIAKLGLSPGSTVQHDLVVVPDTIGFQGDILLRVDFLTKYRVELSWVENC